MEKCFAVDCFNMQVCKCFELASNKEGCKWMDINEQCHYRTEECDNYIPEKDNPYPLCDNRDCAEITTCNIYAHMMEG